MCEREGHKKANLLNLVIYRAYLVALQLTEKLEVKLQSGLGLSAEYDVKLAELAGHD